MAESEIKPYKILVIGGSAGSLSMVLKLLPLLDARLIPVVIVFHRKTTEDDVLIEILSKKTTYKVKEADEKDLLRPGVIYIAPPDYHLLLEKDWTITLDASEKIHYSRPSIDVTFESAAEACGEQLVCVLLSGANADGAAGLAKAQQLGAKVIVQDPASAEVPYMPQQALDNVRADLVIGEENLSDYLDFI